MAAGRVVFPWSTWLIVPMLMCGLFRTNGVFAMACKSFGWKSAQSLGPEDAVGVAVPGPATLLRRLCSADAWREEGQPRAPASHAAAVAPCGYRPADVQATAVKNTRPAYAGTPTPPPTIPPPPWTPPPTFLISLTSSS